MQYVFTINDAAVPGITAARAAYNAALPATVKDGEADVPNPDLIASDSGYLDMVLARAVESWNRQHAVVVVPEVPPVVVSGVPQSVDMVKASVYFSRIGVLDTIEQAVAAQGAEAQIIWQRSKTVQRQNQLMLLIAKQLLGWTDEQIDGHFIEADKVVL